MQQITAVQAPELLMDVMKAGLVPMIVSSPGIGKSSIAKQIAEDRNLKVIDLRLSQCDPSDLLGFPSINKDKTKAGYVPMDTFPIKGDPIPSRTVNGVVKPYAGWLLFLDEMNSAAKSVQAAAYKIVLDRQVGLHDLHKSVAVMAAGNLSTDKAIVTKLGTAMQSRMVHFHLREDFKSWMAWAATSGIDYRITSFLNFKPEALFNFSPDHNDCTFACPRTWEFVSKIVINWKEIGSDKSPLIGGTIGEGMGREFLAFCQVFGELPTISEIVNNPMGTKLSDEPTVRYALTGMIGSHITPNNSDALMKFVDRMPVEFQIITLQSALLRDPSLLSQGSAFDAWVTKHASRLM
jgi:hypothetical protein